MKISVRRKVANGLVICLAAPGAASTIADAGNSAADGLSEFSASDEVDLAAPGRLEARTQAEATVNGGHISDPCDPSGSAPPGYERTCVSNSGMPTTCFMHASQVVTSEGGSHGLIEVWAEGTSSGTHFIQISSEDPSEAKPEPRAIALGPNACRHQAVWVTGQNDGQIDGDGNYEIQIWDENGNFVGAVPGINMDNDTNSGALLNVEGPKTMQLGSFGQFNVIVQNVASQALPSSDLNIETTTGLEITGFATSVIGGGPLVADVTLVDGVLMVQDFSLEADETLLVTVETALNSTGPQGERVIARIIETAGGLGESDDDTRVDAALPESVESE